MAISQNRCGPRARDDRPRHNDLAWNIRKFLHNQLGKFNFSEDLRMVEPWSKSNWSHTDLPRMKAGLIGAQGLFGVEYLLIPVHRSITTVPQEDRQFFRWSMFANFDVSPRGLRCTTLLFLSHGALSLEPSEANQACDELNPSPRVDTPAKQIFSYYR
ncbi:hypothetical protein AAG570_013657 [Ranatra chinensis]|uniref:Uncharacterized protein n=1 Tax=Ranatra chinensis TaxID=642074 RepID=A0ABD0YD32_9HEMI